MNALYQLRNVKFQYLLGRQTVQALRNVSCSIEAGALVCISGPSGSGKSTLLNLLGLIELPQEGEILFQGQDFKALKESERNKLRKFEIGFVFQSFQLFPVMTALENVEYFLYRQGLPAQVRAERSKKALEAVGLWQHRQKKPLEMSGGQRQRVAIARALAKQPKVIIADEPTASLDQNTGRDIMELFSMANLTTGATLIVSSHDPMVQKICPTRLHLLDGELETLPAPPLSKTGLRTEGQSKLVSSERMAGEKPGFETTPPESLQGGAV